MKKKILIIDDDQDILDITNFLFEQKGYEVIASLNTDILSELFQITPDVILLDDWLDGTSGHEACKILKAAEATKHIPVIMFSAVMQIEKVAEDCLADGFVKKPFDIDTLVEVIERHLTGTYK
ncbi:MAG: response regulator [Daejeonella sp.]|uniref:response regulator n=1 Tax=Daejeonella sp. TaxID=2805397 RepID=UPI003C74405D